MTDTATALLDDLREPIRRYLQMRPPSAEPSTSLELRESWARLASELGLPGLSVPEHLGGAGLGAAEIVAVHEELARGLYGGPFLSTGVMAIAALEAVGEHRLQTDIAAGQAIFGSLLSPESISYADGRLSGTAVDVIDGVFATHFLVFAREENELVLAELKADSSGVASSALRGIDLTRSVAKVDLEGAKARVLARGESAQAALAAVRDSLHLGLAAESCGVAARCLEMAVAYARERVQFGRPIGSFQAIKHRCADLLVKLELSRSAIFLAVQASARGAEDRAKAAHMAKAVCTEVGFAVAWENIQIHGGIGYTWEHPAHLYFRRAKSNELLGGHPSQHRRRLADLLPV